MLRFSIKNSTSYYTTEMLRSFATSCFRNSMDHGLWQRIAETNPSCIVRSSSVPSSANDCPQMMRINESSNSSKFSFFQLHLLFTSIFLITIYLANLYAVAWTISVWAKTCCATIYMVEPSFRNNNWFCLEGGAIQQTVFRTLKFIFIIFAN